MGLSENQVETPSEVRTLEEEEEEKGETNIVTVSF